MRTPIRVLLIDDSHEDRQIYRRLLEQSPTKYVVYEAHDKCSGLEEAGHHQPDCILLDLRLEGESGYEILFALKDQDHLRGIPVIMLTGAAWNPLKDGARSLGASGYLVKGKVDASGLDHEIRSAMSAAKTLDLIQQDGTRKEEHAGQAGPSNRPCTR